MMARLRLWLARWALRPFGLAIYPYRDVARLQAEAGALMIYSHRSGHLAGATHARRRVKHAAARIAALAGELARVSPLRIGA